MRQLSMKRTFTFYLQKKIGSLNLQILNQKEDRMKLGLSHILSLFVFLDILNDKRYKDVEKHREEEELLPYLSKNQHDKFESCVEGMKPT